MPEKPVVLTLNQEQQFVLFAQVLTFMFSLAYHPAPQSGETIERLKDVAYEVRPWRGDAQASLEMSLSSETIGVLKHMIGTLETLHVQWPQHKDSLLALQHLKICRTLIEEAEQQAKSEIGSE